MDTEKTLDMKTSSVLPLEFSDKNALYAAYMPFIKNGALFMETTGSYDLGDEVFLQLRLMDETEKYSLLTKVIWITPLCAQAARKAGVGLQFVSENAKEMRNKIETYLAGAFESARETDTV